MSIVAKRLDGSRWHLAWIEPRPRRHCVRCGPSSLPKQGTQLPRQFSAHVYCGQTAVCVSIPLGTEVGLSLCDTVLGGDLAPHPLKGHSPQFSANVRCGQTAGWIKMPLGMEVGLVPGVVVLDGDPAPSPHERCTAAPLFSVHVYCGHSRPSQLLLSSCVFFNVFRRMA